MDYIDKYISQFENKELLKNSLRERINKLSQNSFYNNPKISIVIPSYNQGSFLEKTILSILLQDYLNYEIILIDGGSNDNSLEIINRYSEFLSYWVSEKDKGQADAINKGLAVASGEVFNWLNSDDYLEENALTKIADAYKKIKVAAGWVGACRRFDENGRTLNIIYPNNLERENIGQNWNGRQFYQPACFLNTNFVKELGGVDNTLNAPFDLDLWIKILEKGKFVIGSGIWANALIHGNAKTQKARTDMFNETIAVQNKYGFAEGAENRFERVFNGKQIEFIIPEDLRKALSKYEKSSEKNSLFNIPNREIVFISGYLPRFDKTSSNKRVYEILTILLENKFNVTYIYKNSTPDDDKYKSSLKGNISFVQQDFSISNYVDILNFSKASYLWITNLWEETYFHFINDLVKEVKSNSGIKVIVDTMDFHFKKFIRRYNLTKNEFDLKRAEVFLEEEKKLYPKADMVLTVTENEKEDILKSINGIRRIEVIPNIHEENKIQKSFSERRNICFLGNFRVNHNVDAVRFFVNKIFPVISEYIPDIEFHLIGNEAEKLTSEFSLPRVKIIGYVENLDEVLAGYKLFVCPMLYGAGLKGKIGEAAAAGLPIVTTSIGAEGSFMEDGVDCFIADDINEFAFKCIHLLNDYICWNNFSIKSKLNTLQNYGRSSVSKKLHILFNNELDIRQPEAKRLVRAGLKTLFDSDLLKINWVITRKCNYTCSYCNVYNNVKGYSQPLEKLKTAVDQIALLNRKNIHITLTGGEPTLHPGYAEFMFYITGKLKNKLLISTVTNLSRTKRYFTELCNKLQPYKDNVNFRASYHFEFADKEKFIENAKLISDYGFLIYVSILAHPDKMDEVFYLESQFKKISNDKLKYELIVVREDYGSEPDKRYSPDDLDNLKNFYTKATEHKGIILDWEDPESKSIERNYYSMPELNAKGLNKFKGMVCNAGINMFSINESGDVDKAVCFRQVKHNKKNIYSGDNIVDEISQPVVCPFDSCGCLADLQLPKYLPGYESLSSENLIGRNANDLLNTRLNLVGWEYKSDIYNKDFTSVQELKAVSSPKLSIVVISWRLHQDTLKNFQILEQQRDINFELIFVNNGGSDKEFEPLKPFINTYVRLNRNTGAYVARNIGSLFAKSDILLFLEDDGIPEKDLLKQHLRIYNEYYVIALRGVYLPKTNNPLNRIQKHYYLGETPFPYYLNLEGNLSIKAESFFKAGGFNDEIIYGHGGPDLAYRLKELYPEMEPGWYFPYPKIYHDYASTSEGLKDKIQIQEKSLQSLKKKYDGFEKFIEKYRSYYKLLTFQKEYNVNKLAEECNSFLTAYKITNNELNLKLFSARWEEKKELYGKYFTSVEFKNIIDSPSISVIIISWRLHPDTLRSFEILQKQRNQNYELIFVDNGGKENEFEKLKPFIDTYVKLNTNTGAYLARNIGALFANAPILFFLEDDGIPADNIVEAHLRNHDRYDIIALRGVYVPKTLNPSNRVAGHYYLGDKPKSIFADLEGNTSYKASVFFRVGGWDDKINFGGGGVDLALRLLKIDGDKRKQIYSPEPVMYHDFAADANHLAAKQEKQQKSREYLRAKHADWDKVINEWTEYSMKEGIKLIEKKTDLVKRSSAKETFISVCIPTYNRADYLKEAIKSALNQNYDNFEIVIVDDGSTDNTEEIVKEFASPRVRYIKKKNEGRPKTRNRLISEAKGDYILWLDDDDLLAEGMIEEYNSVLKNDPPVDVIYGNLQAFDSDSGSNLQLFEPDDYTNDSSQLLANLISGKGITFGGSLIRKKLIEEAGGFDDEFLRAQDNELWTRLALKAKFHKLNKVIYLYRKHNTNVSMNDFIDRSYESKIIRKIVSAYSLRDIYPFLNWENYDEAESKALTGIVNGLSGFGDFYNGAKILSGKKSKITGEDLMMLFNLYLKSGNIVCAGEILKSRNKEFKDGQNNAAKSLLFEYSKLLSLINENNLEYVKSELENYINKNGYSFIHAFIIAQIYKNTVDFLPAYRYFRNAVYFNPEDTKIYEEANSIALKIGMEGDLAAMRNRMLEEIPFFTEKKKTVDSLVSVIIPTYNRPHKLSNAIESVLSQSYKNFEIIVVKDGGKDVSAILKKFNDCRIKVINHNKNRGPSSARNAGIRAAKGKYIALLDDDDIFYSNHLETALTNLDEKNKVIYTDAVRCTYIKEGTPPEVDYKLQSKSIPYSIDYSRNKLFVGNISPINCFVFEKSLTDKIGMFDESLQVLEDWEFWLRLSSTTDFKHIKENTVQVNWYNDGSTLTSSKQEAFGKVRTTIYKKYESEINAIPNMNEIVEEFNAIWRKDNAQQEPLVSIVALTYNQLEYTKAFVESVFKYTKIPYELVLVDNNSNDETVKYLTELTKRNSNVRVIFNKENLGFPKGVNQGIKRAYPQPLPKGKGLSKLPLPSEGGRGVGFFLIANNDIIVTEGWLERMIHVAESDSSIGIVGPISNSVSGVQLDKDAAYSSIEEMHAYAEKIKAKNAGKSFVFPRVAFLCTLIKREVIEKIGGLDERFSPGNFEDDDFCLRAQIAGYKTIIAQDVFIHHFGSKSFTAEGLEKYKVHLETNKNIFINKWNADPEEIWLKGKSIKERNIMYPINDNRFIESFERARILIEDREYDTALDSLKAAVDNFDSQSASRFNIDEPELFNLAGNVALMNNELSTAKDYFEYALNKNPRSSKACAGLAEILFIDKNYEAAKTMFEYAVSYDENNAGAQEGLKRVNSVLESTSGYEMRPDKEVNSLLINKRDDFGYLFNSLNLLGHGVEIGVQAGEFSRILRSAWKGKYLHLIDRWQNVPDYKDICNVSDEEQKKLYNLVVNTFFNNPDVFIYKMDSAFAAQQFPDEHFDWIYIDADHSYKGCKRDLEIWYPKLKRGGIFAGHDFINGKFAAGEFGVKTAVEEFIKDRNVELCLTMDDYLKSWYFIKPGDTQIKQENEYQISLGTTNKGDKKGTDNLVNEAYDLFKSGEYNESLNKILIAEKQFNGHLSEPAYSSLAAAFFNLKGFNYLGLNKIEEAKENFERALSLDPNSSEACAGLGEYFYISGNNENARIMFEFAVKNNPENSFALEGLSKSNSPDEDDSKKLLVKLEEILSSVFNLFELKRYNNALEALQSTEQLFYSQLKNEEKNHLISTYENLKGMIFLALNNNGDAKKSFELALSINPSSSQACAGLGEAFFLSGNDKEAKAMYEWAVKNNPGNKFASEGLGKVNLVLGFEKSHNSLENK